MSLDRVVVVGCGAAGLAVCRELRARGYDGNIIVVEQSSVPPVPKPALVSVVAGRLEPSQASQRYHQLRTLGVQVLWGYRAVELAHHEDCVVARCAQGGQVCIEWDALVLAVGARPVLPAVFEAGRQVLHLHTRAEAVMLRELVRRHGSLVIVGGGPIACKLGCELAPRGCRVTVISASPWLMARMLDGEAGYLAARVLTNRGVDVRLGTELSAVQPRGNTGAILKLKTGDTLAADCVVVAKGQRPDVRWLQDSGVRLGREGILTDLEMKTSRDRVWACGDCAEVAATGGATGVRFGSWSAAVNQARVVAGSILGLGTSYCPHAGGNVVTLGATQFVAFGRSEQRTGIRVLARRGPDRYARLTLRRSRLVAAVMVGEALPVGLVRHLILRGTLLSEDELCALAAGDLDYIVIGRHERGDCDV